MQQHRRWTAAAPAAAAASAADAAPPAVAGLFRRRRLHPHRSIECAAVAAEMQQPSSTALHHRLCCACGGSGISGSRGGWRHECGGISWRRRRLSCSPPSPVVAAAAAAEAAGYADDDGVGAPQAADDAADARRLATRHLGRRGAAAPMPPLLSAAAAPDGEPYSLEDTKALVETAMLAAVSGLAFLLSTLLKLDSSLGYFLPLPVAIAACRSGPRAAWGTMTATAFLLLVLLGPLRAVTYVLMHGMTAAALATLWVWRWTWAISVFVGAALRMLGQVGYLALSSAALGENLFAVMVANVHSLMDRLSASIGASGAPSHMAIVCMIFALLLVNAVCYNFLMHVIGHIALRAMGYDVGQLPGFMRRYLYGGDAAPPPPPTPAAPSTK